MASAPAAPFTSGAANEGGAIEYLAAHGWPNGLQRIFLNNMKSVFRRYFILDNSGSMAANDGHRIVGEGIKKVSVASTRWAELGDFTRFHAGLAEAASVECQFRLLNGSPPLVLGSSADGGMNYRALMEIMNNSPGGGTPLCYHLRQVIDEITPMKDYLLSTGQRVVVVIATDGESSDGDIATAMKPLQQLPVWVVIRLCTDEEKIVSYWNNIDSALELDMDILDDFGGEAAEVHANNKWLCYGEPIHRIREFGVTLKEFDLLDEGAITGDQAIAVIRMIFGGELREYPNGYVDFNGLVEVVQRFSAMEPLVWNPILKKGTPWIDVNHLGEAFGKKKSFCVIS